MYRNDRQSAGKRAKERREVECAAGDEDEEMRRERTIERRSGEADEGAREKEEKEEKRTGCDLCRSHGPDPGSHHYAAIC